MLTQDQIMDLGAHLMSNLDPNGPRVCDSTHQHTREWLSAHDFDIDDGLRYLASRRGYCDCEVIFNVCLPAADQFREAEAGGT